MYGCAPVLVACELGTLAVEVTVILCPSDLTDTCWGTTAPFCSSMGCITAADNCCGLATLNGLWVLDSLAAIADATLLWAVVLAGFTQP